MPKRPHAAPRSDARKERRKAERATRAGRVDGQARERARESTTRMAKERAKLLVATLDKRLSSALGRLTQWEPPPPPKTPEEIKAQRRAEAWERKWKLKGAARPATEVYPELYPEIEQAKRDEEARHRAALRNLLDEFAHNLWQHEATRIVVALRVQLGFAQLALGAEAVKAFAGALGDDPADPLGARCGLVLAHLDNGDPDQARAFLDEVQGAAPELLWNRVLVEFIARFILNQTTDDGALMSALGAANDANPYVGHMLAAHDHVAAMLDPSPIELAVREERDTRIAAAIATGRADCAVGRCDGGACADTGERAYAVAYWVAHMSMWRDAEGACDFARLHVKRVPEAALPEGASAVEKLMLRAWDRAITIT